MTAEEKKQLTMSRFDYNYFIFDAVYSDEGPMFLSNPEPREGETVTATIRVAAGGADGVTLVIRKANGDEARTEARLTRSEGCFDYYGAPLSATGVVRYAFIVRKGRSSYWHNKRGTFVDHDPAYDFTAAAGFKTPDWAKGAVFYQIYVDRFRNGDPTNDVASNEYAYMRRAAKRIDDWNEPVANDDIANFYGGDIAGIWEKLPYLKDLGVEVIYLNPIFVSPSNHKYDAQDYDYIDPHYGVIVEDGGETLKFDKFLNRFATKYMKRTTNITNLEASNAFFARFITACHNNGIRVIIDGVFNHCGAFNKWLDREGFYQANGYPAGAYRDANSPYRDYFRWYDDAWPNNECYDGWWGHENHPKLYYEGSASLYQYILGVAKKWVSPPFNADGWRLDVAADLGYSPEVNHRFWRDFREAVKSANPDALVLAEHYGDPSAWLKGNEWDTIMNYDAFMEPLTWFLTGMEKHSEQYRSDMLNNAMAFEGAMRYHSVKMPYPALSVAMNELSNHDHSRFLTRTNMTAGRLHTMGPDAADSGLNIGIMMEAVAFQFCWQGAPTIYYGDEAGVTGWTDPDNRRTFPWGRENKTLTAFHKEAAALRKRYGCLRKGSSEYLYLHYGVLSFGRWDDDGIVACCLNNNGAAKRVALPVWKLGAENGDRFAAALTSSGSAFAVNAAEHVVRDGFIELDIPAYGSVILALT